MHLDFLPMRFACVALFALAVAAGGAPLAGTVHADGATQLSFDDWIAAQGSCEDLDADSTCGEDPDDLYVPPTRNFLGWTGNDSPDGVYDILGAVDYAGIAAAWLLDECDDAIDLGTTTSGSVTAHDIGDGQVLVSVRLHTTNALGWAGDNSDGDFNFATAPLLFGARPGDVCAGATPGIMSSEMHVEYYADASAPYVDIGTFPPMRTLSIHASGTGPLPDGSPARLTIRQTGPFQSHSHASSWDFFPAEALQIQPVGN